MADQIAIIIADLEEYTRLEVIDLGRNVVANLRESPPLGTPRDTGWAAANWIASVGTPTKLDSANTDPTPGEVAARSAIAERSTNDLLNWQPTEGPIFATNTVPYIEPLNAGHSKQSPAAFVQKAIEKAAHETEAVAANKGSRNRRAARVRGNKARPIQ